MFASRLPKVSRLNGEGGIRTRGRSCNPYDGLANRYLQPLGHLSKKTILYKFSFTLYPTGQYCKKIRGKLYYFNMDGLTSKKLYQLQLEWRRDLTLRTEG